MKNYLICPVCKADMGLTDDKKSFVCAGEGKRHCFDLSRSGYLNLALSHSAGGDSKEAVRARTSFLEAGYYEGISDAVNELISKYAPSLAVDAGCGEGYYTNRAAKCTPKCDFLGFDLSKHGVEYAAKSASRGAVDNAFYAVSSIYTMPLGDGSADMILNIFAPCAEDEFSRVLKDGGYLVLAGAGERHLFGLKSVLYDEPYLNAIREDLPKRLEFVEKRKVSYTITVKGNENIQNLFSMTPYYFRTSLEDKKKLDGLNELTTEVDVDVFVYKKI